MSGSTSLHAWAALIGHSGLEGGMLREYGGSWRELEGVKGGSYENQEAFVDPRSVPSSPGNHGPLVSSSGRC